MKSWNETFNTVSRNIINLDDACHNVDTFKLEFSGFVTSTHPTHPLLWICHVLHGLNSEAQDSWLKAWFCFLCWSVRFPQARWYIFFKEKQCFMIWYNRLRTANWISMNLSPRQLTRNEWFTFPKQSKSHRIKFCTHIESLGLELFYFQKGKSCHENIWTV